MKKLIFVLFLVVWIFVLTSYAKKDSRETGDFSVMFYNLENLFDTLDNPLKADDEYTPSGLKNWNSSRYRQKLRHIRQVVCAADFLKFPDVIGVCEIENQKVLEDLISDKPLRKVGYRIFHRESSDRRGIDNALLYNPETFKILDTNVLKINFKDTSYHSRDILYVKGNITKTKDTLHIFVNHWPSHYGGDIQTEASRFCAAKKLRFAADSVLKISPNAAIICIGDFNDSPNAEALTVGLKAGTFFSSQNPDSLYNISYYLQYKKKLWTYNYQNDYDILDQVIVSGSLLKTDKLHVNPDFVYPLRQDFMLTYDDAGNPKPLRTYNGYKYEGGFSDHLPVIVNFFRGQ